MVRAEKRSSMEGNGGDYHGCEECTRNCQLMHGQKTDTSCAVSRFFKILVGREWPKTLLLPPSVSATVAKRCRKETELENAYGKKWTVTLTSYGTRLAFQKGWEKFVLDNDLQGGDLLVFTYVNGSNFAVHVFGKTGTEKISKSSPVPQRTSPVNPQSGRRSQAEDLTSKTNTEKDHAGIGSLAEANKDYIGTKSKVTDVSTEKEHTGRKSLSKAIEDRIQDRIRAKKMGSNMHTKVTDVSMSGKDQRSSACEAKVSMNAEEKPPVLRDDSTCKCEKETAGIHLFGKFLEEPGQKGNEENSLGANNDAAVFPKSGQKSTGHLKKIVEKEQQESSEPGHNDAKRKRGFESAPEGRRSVFKTAKTEPFDDDSSAGYGTFSCLAVIHDQHLELPDRLPALKFMRRGSKAVYLVDEKKRLWPAMYEEVSGLLILRCHWDRFNPANGVQDGDSYVFTVENASQFIYRIDVLRKMQG